MHERKSESEVRKRKSESEVAQLCSIPRDPMDCSLPGSSVHGIFQARVLEWVAIAFSSEHHKCLQILCSFDTVAHQAPLPMRFSRQEYWSGLPCPHPGDPPDPGIEPTSLMSPALAGGFFTSSATWKALWKSTGQFLHRMSLLFPHD